MLFFKVGECVEQFIGSSQGIMWDVDSSGASLIFIIKEEYLSQYRLGGHYDFFFTRFNETMFICVKLGNNPWASAPYTPHCSPDFELVNYEKGMGMPVKVMLINATNGIIQQIDFLVLGHDFSANFMYNCEDILSSPFDSMGHQLTIQAVYQRHLTDEELTTTKGVFYSID